MAIVIVGVTYLIGLDAVFVWFCRIIYPKVNTATIRNKSLVDTEWLTWAPCSGESRHNVSVDSSKFLNRVIPFLSEPNIIVVVGEMKKAKDIEKITSCHNFRKKMGFLAVGLWPSSRKYLCAQQVT